MFFKVNMWPQKSKQQLVLYLLWGIAACDQHGPQWCSVAVWCSLAELIYSKHPELIWCQLSLHYSPAGRVLESWGECHPFIRRRTPNHNHTTTQPKLSVLCIKKTHLNFFLVFSHKKGNHLHLFYLFGAKYKEDCDNALTPYNTF